ncbi:MAG: 1-deoxy-D-xylulose-5-phosphate synthase [SAR324 cluster bacterium]|nr:1-deoxy-D-xylulose-5-phosphate synthase [SAR324 cluster bacterium]
MDPAPDKYPLLSALDDPAAVKAFSRDRLSALSEEARAFLIETIHSTGGHLGAALGVVELTVALFNQFNFLEDRIAWDVGHQAHVHKLLTGRAGRFGDYGQWGGLCKFLERRESPYDHMGAGHASTSISAALGMAVARDLSRQDHHVIAVVGDGAMTGGLAYEALNMAGSLDLNLLVILNDNGMSIDHNVGAFARRMGRTVTRITASNPYNALRDEVKRVTRHVPFGSEILRGLKYMERSLKEYVSGDEAIFFESLGFRYFGPVDGHDLSQLIPLLNHTKAMRGPILLHLNTVKGKGLGPEIENTFEAHAVSPGKPAAGKTTAGKTTVGKTTAEKPGAKPKAERKTWTRIYSEGLRDLMSADDKVVALTAAMQSNTGLAPLAEEFPGRVLDMGIAEANAYCSAAGMAIGGLKPFVTIYSTFSQRAFDQLIHDIALQKLPVRVMMDRGGLVGADGPTHHGVFDFSYLRLIPGFVHMAPRNEKEMRRMLLTAHAYQDGPIAMRYARGDTEAMKWRRPLEPIPVGKGEVLRRAPRGALLLLAVGSMVETALDAADALAGEDVPCAVVDCRFIKPLDEALLRREIGKARAILTLEENVLAGGLGEAVLAMMAEAGLSRPARLLGVPDRFIGFGGRGDQLQDSGLAPHQVLEAAQALWRETAGIPRGKKQRTA